MKEKDAVIKSDNKQIVLFVEKEDGSYGAVQTSPYMLTNFIDDYWEKIRTIEEACRPRVQAGEISPVDYWRQLRMMTVPDLAARMGLSPGTVKKHFQPKHYKKLVAPVLQRYAEILGIPLEAFSNITGEYTMNIIHQGQHAE